MGVVDRDRPQHPADAQVRDVNALLGGIDHAAVDPRSGRALLRHTATRTRSGNDRIAIRRLTFSGGNVTIGNGDHRDPARVRAPASGRRRQWHGRCLLLQLRRLRRRWPAELPRPPVAERQPGRDASPIARCWRSSRPWPRRWQPVDIAARVRRLPADEVAGDLLLWGLHGQRRAARTPVRTTPIPSTSRSARTPNPCVLATSR